MLSFSVYSQNTYSGIEGKLREAREISRSNPKEALELGKEALEEAKKSNRIVDIQNSYLVIGEIYRVLGELRNAEKSVRNAYSPATDSLLLPDVLRELGIILKQQTRFSEALPLYIEAAGYYQECKKEREVAKMYNNIGRLYYAMDDLEMALHYYTLALDLHKKLEPSSSVGITYHNIGAIYEARGELNAAHKEYSKALKIYQEFDDKVLIAYGLNSLGNVEPHIATARKFLEEGLKLREELGLEKDYIESRLNIAKLELRVGNEVLAIDHFRWVFSEASRFDLLRFALTSSKELSKIYERRNNLLEALEYTRHALILQDSLHVREERVKELGFEFRIKEVSLNDSIADLNRINELKELEIKVRDKELEARRQAQIFWIAFSVMILLVVIVTAYLLIRQRKINNELQIQKALIEEKSAENEILIREIHHRVKNNLHSVLGILRIERRRLEAPEAIEAFEATEQKVGTIATIHELLYSQDNLSQVELEDYIESVAQKILEFSPDKDVSIIVGGSSQKVDAELALPIGQIIAELVTNSLKYAFADEEHPAILVSVKMDADFLIIRYSDNGCGINTELKDSGFGMKMIQSLVRKRGGKVRMEESEGFSMEFSFSVSDIQ